LVEGLKAMVPALERIAALGDAMGLEPEVFNHLRQYVSARAQELTALV
jgi:serine/threonine-protein kinase HipA